MKQMETLRVGPERPFSSESSETSHIPQTSDLGSFGGLLSGLTVPGPNYLSEAGVRLLRTEVDFRVRASEWPTPTLTGQNSSLDHASRSTFYQWGIPIQHV